MKNKLFIIVIVVCLPLCGFAQRHFKGVSGIEASAGSRLSGSSFNPVINVAYSKYLRYRTYMKMGLNYEVIDVNMGRVGKAKAYNYNFEPRFAYTFLDMPNISQNFDFFVSIQGGAIIGLERTNRLNQFRHIDNIPYVEVKNLTKNRLIAGGVIALESEFFFKENIGVIVGISEQYMGTSKICKFHTVLTAGIKYLLP